MNPLSESSTRTPIDYFHFGITFFGCIIGAAGVVMTSVGVLVLGAVLIAMGLAYFLVGD